MNRGLYIEGNDWCGQHHETDLFDYFNIEFVEVGEDNEITRVDADEEGQLGERAFGYYTNEDMAMVGGVPDRIRGLDGSHPVFVCNEDYVRSVFFDGGGAYRAYSQSICFLGLNNEHDFDRAEFLEDVLADLAGYGGSVYGQVVDDDTNAPIENATITVVDANIEVVSDEDGMFELYRFPHEQFMLTVTADGYQAVEAAEFTFNGEMELDVQVRMRDLLNVAEDDNTPSEFGIVSLYPNPFNPMSTVSFRLDRASDVNLSLFDINGSLVMEATGGRMSAGSHSIRLDTRALNSGMYIIRLNSGSKTDVIKGILIK